MGFAFQRKVGLKKKNSAQEMGTLEIDNSYLHQLKNLEKRKHILKIKIIRHLYVYGPKSNAELCNDFNISTPTSVGVLSELNAEGLVEKQGRGKSEGGRRPDLFGLRDQSLFVLSISIGRFKTRMAIFDNNNNNITGTRSFPLDITEGLDAIEQLHLYAEDLIRISGIDSNKLLGIGISMPGLVSANEGINYTYMQTHQGNLTLQQKLRNRFDKPVYIQNDVKSAALAEYHFGQARGKNNVLVLSLDWGIGMGIIMNGKLCSGSAGFSGEIGHIPLVNDGALCYCGKRGCLETVASGIALARLAKEGIQSGQHSLLQELSDQAIDNMEPQQVIDAAIRGDAFAINLLTQIGMELGKGIAILIQLFNPELIILGGKLAEAKQYITTPIQQAVNTYCMAQLRDKTAMVLSDLAQDAGILGSVALVMENLFEEY